MFCFHFFKKSFVVKKAEEDADYVIIKSAFELQKEPQFVAIVGEDIDILVIMAASTNSENTFFLKPERGKAEDVLYRAAILNISPNIRDNTCFFMRSVAAMPHLIFSGSGRRNLSMF
ncbi:hypothetical protein AVEN_67452-1 [Araneus ventricosus]|uniref:Uncharacterized protein n=1 Tax=Araneus ventricosus TaxID=182803 RepID=A0A4Y2KVD7_ARAVE|nr:hypothetical protein AVEN_67452-1 [Araneus ventricosus]